MNHQYYLHTNGQLIHKPIQAVIEGDFVRKVWVINTESRGSAWLLCIEAAALDANIERIRELSGKWGLTFEDSIDFLAYIHVTGGPSEIQKEGLEIFATKILGYKDLDDYLDAALIAGNARQLKQKNGKIKHCTNLNHDEVPQKDCTECMWDMDNDENTIPI